MKAMLLLATLSTQALAWDCKKHTVTATGGTLEFKFSMTPAHAHLVQKCSGFGPGRCELVHTMDAVYAVNLEQPEPKELTLEKLSGPGPEQLTWTEKKQWIPPVGERSDDYPTPGHYRAYAELSTDGHILCSKGI